ncbi:MlaD family protein [Patulibacter brassicae]|jgi:ABC-type transporter Mla subunit MlaD|uniref:MlaD family protein n=1 Tax=Patulibacter brassicae TaxID=1705717 RepID=A0ABU4VIY6_9ACTN|nr:MlaD family protein [Patulibacter brassicae]MDX8151794.1 MlaD family protein [Patulibacter brassicae]
MSGVRGALLPLLVGVATVGVVLLGRDLLFDHSGGYVVRAEIADAAGLRRNSAVKVGGATGGRVTDVTLTRRDTAMVTMRLDDEAAPIGAGASARARPVNLLGEKFVDLDPGDVRHPRASASTIPLRRTASPVELDDVLNALGPDVRARLRILVNEAGVALAGRGADLNALLAHLPPALDELGRTVDDLGRDNARMRRLIVAGERVVGDVDGRRDDLAELVAQADAALRVTARRRAALGATIDRAPQALTQLGRSVGVLAESADRLVPAASRLRASAPALRQALQRAPGFADDARGTLRTARAVAPALTRLGREGTGPVGRLEPLTGDLAQLAAELEPVTTTLDRTIADALGFVHGYARAQQERDGLGHVLRLRLIVGRTALEALGRGLGGSSAPSSSRARSSSSPRPARGGERDRPGSGSRASRTARPAAEVPGRIQRLLREVLAP